SWKVTPYAPSSASLCTASAGSSAGRIGVGPNTSTPFQPTVHSPKENLSSRVGVYSVIARSPPSAGRGVRPSVFFDLLGSENFCVTTPIVVNLEPAPGGVKQQESPGTGLEGRLGRRVS